MLVTNVRGQGIVVGRYPVTFVVLLFIALEEGFVDLKWRFIEEF